MRNEVAVTMENSNETVVAASTGVLFSKLLDIAYCLFFGGFIVNNFDPTDLHQPIAIPSEELWLGTARIAAFLLLLREHPPDG
jgi:hypothetical protein